MPDRTAQELEVVSKIMDELVQEIGAMDMDNPERAKGVTRSGGRERIAKTETRKLINPQNQLRRSEPDAQIESHPTRGFSVLLPYRDYATLSVAMCIYSSV